MSPLLPLPPTAVSVLNDTSLVVTLAPVATKSAPPRPAPPPPPAPPLPPRALVLLIIRLAIETLIVPVSGITNSPRYWPPPERVWPAPSMVMLVCTTGRSPVARLMSDVKVIVSPVWAPLTGSVGFNAVRSADSLPTGKFAARAGAAAKSEAPITATTIARARGTANLKGMQFP